MPLSLNPTHISRYSEIARLLFKYGRGDLLKGSGIEDPGSDHMESAAAANAGKPLVHERAGEVLDRQREAQERRKNGKETPVITLHEDPVGAPEDKAASLADDLEAMGPTYVKVGQFLSTRADLLPLPYLAALARLQDHVEPFAYAEVERIVTEELGVRISKAFHSFDPEPLAAASLGQVHRAELRNGCVVAVKVQRPGIREKIEEDLKVLAEIAAVLDRHSEYGKRFGFANMLDEFSKSLIRELDYRQEARNLSILSKNLADFDRLMVPTPVADYVTPRVLTMEFVRGRKITALGPLAKLDLDGAPLAEDLCRAYLQQIMVDGFFHADPHPGNVLLTDDGRLAIIDLGMVGQLATSMQESLLKLVMAVSEGRGEDAGDIIIRIGKPADDADPDEVRRLVAEQVMQFQGLRLRDIALGRLLLDAAHCATSAGYAMPRELTMLSKTLLNIDEVSRTLDPEFDPNASIRRNASDITRKRMLKSLSPGALFSGLLELKELTQNMPRALNQMMDAVIHNRVRVKVDAINEALLMEGMQKVANRITIGLVISAMIVGAALLMRIETSFRILGYPGLAILFFLAAGIAAIVMVTNIVVSDLRASKDKVQGQER